MAKYMITTTDNPFDPSTDFDSWYNFDVDKGYNTCSLLDRVTPISDQLSEQENDRLIESGIDRIIAFDPLNIYTKVKIED